MGTTLSKSQIERLGVRLVREPRPSSSDLELLHQLLAAHGDVLADAVDRVRAGLHVDPSSRIKNTGTILEKLRRHGGSWLKSIHDLAGMRIVGAFDRNGQDEIVDRIVSLFDDEPRRPKVIDRRAQPSQGYSAVHVIVFPERTAVEIQVRTAWQHEWAELFEKLADRIGRDIRYGGPPAHPGTLEQRAAMPDALREAYDLAHALRVSTVDMALAIAGLIAAVEAGEASQPDDPGLAHFRRSVADALVDLQEALEDLP